MTAAGGALPLPPAVPQFPPHAGRRLCGWVLHCCGWRLLGTFPDQARLILIAAPHTSWWDGVWGLLFKVAVGVDITFLGKRELFRGPLGWILRRLGGIPIERSTPHGVVEQIAARFRTPSPLWVGLAPEGTRKQAGRWRTGFWQIARVAGVPILPIAFDYPTRTLTLGPLFLAGADLAHDLGALGEFYAPFRGKRPRVGGPPGAA